MLILPSPKAVIAAVRARGSNAIDLRDAAHEAAHALDAKLPAGRWDRRTIHQAVIHLGGRRSPLLRPARSEILARAVERLVCADLGVDPGPLNQWVGTAMLEAAGSGLLFPSAAWLTEEILAEMRSADGRELANAVLALADAHARPARSM